MIREHIIFTGRVQGVGFRYRAQYIARSLGLTGWVYNMPNGKVEMEVQGSRAEIERMIVLLHEQPFIQIDHMEMKECPLQDEVSFKVSG